MSVVLVSRVDSSGKSCINCRETEQCYLNKGLSFMGQRLTKAHITFASKLPTCRKQTHPVSLDVLKKA